MKLKIKENSKKLSYFERDSVYNNIKLKINEVVKYIILYVGSFGISILN